MTFFGMAFLVAVLVIGVYALVTNSDIFSPGKFYVFSFILFFGGIAFGEWEALTYVLVTFVGLVGVLTVVAESKMGVGKNGRSNSSSSSESKAPVNVYAIAIIWIITLPAIAAKAYLIFAFGGIEQYVTLLNFRVLEFRGYGHLTSIANTYMIINLIYFGFLNQRKARQSDWLLFIAHFVGLIAFGALTLSRGAILNGFVLLLLIFHYQRKQIPLWLAMTAAVGLVFLAGIIGTARENLRFEEGGFSTGLDVEENMVKHVTLSSGVVPLDILSKSDLEKLKFGSTIVSVITNVIPRELWPEKPDTGGVVFTTQYAGDQWLGLSNLTPTFLGELILNFGWIAGILLFLICYPWLMFWILKMYRKIMFAKMVDKCSDDYFINIILYILLMWLVIALMVGEITNTITPFVVTKLIPLLFIRWTFNYFGIIKSKPLLFK